MDDVVIVREDDPRCSALEADGYRIVGRSWGARLRFADSPDLTRLEQVVTKVRATGIAIQELDAGFANALFELELANNADYPFTPATHQPLPVMREIEGLWLHGKRVFGAVDNGRLVGAVVGEVNDGVGDNDFASVLADYRGSGVGAAIAAASIIAFANDGVRTFTAGGAGANDASLGLVRSLGFTVDEQWCSYQR
ncbi:GNAT family N-acetyltransferase [Rhodoglobus sp. NPDC076762]